MRRLQVLLGKVHESILDSMYESVKNGQRHVLALINITDDIQVDVELTGYDAEICVFNSRNNLERYYPNIECEIAKNLPLWDEINVDDDLKCK